MTDKGIAEAGRIAEALCITDKTRDIHTWLVGMA